MTTINTQEDFLKALDDNPQWRDAVRAKLLGEDLLALPAKFDAFVAQMSAFVEQMSSFVARQSQFNEQVRQDVDELKGQVSRLEVKVDQRGQQLDRLEIKVDQRGEQLDRLEVKVDQHGEQLDRLEGQVGEQGVRLSRVEGHVSNIRGSDYERKVARLSRSIARRTLNIKNPRIVHSVRDRDGDELADLSDEAIENGLITAEEADDLERTDLILTGTSADGNELYVLAEASVTVSHLDIERARTRAAILQKAVGAPVQPAVACAEISPENRQQAHQEGVTVIIEPE